MAKRDKTNAVPSKFGIRNSRILANDISKITIKEAKNPILTRYTAKERIKPEKVKPGATPQGKKVLTKIVNNSNNFIQDAHSIKAK